MTNLNHGGPAHSPQPGPTDPLSTSLPNMRPSKDALSPVLIGLEPAAVWEQFDEIARIPRPSGHEELVREHLRDFARENGFKVKEDAAGNLVIEVPGRGAGANAPTVVIQAHMDMVCVKDAAVQHDFMKDPIKLQIVEKHLDGAKKEVLTACGTTLGADNGVGLATGLAAAVSREIVDCPPLELLCTFDEERGLTGAKELDPSIVRGRMLINLDTEEHGCIYISCAGGRDMVTEWSLSRVPRDPSDVAVKLSISGLPGGHSGSEIHQMRGNSNVMAIQALLDSRVDLDGVKLASMEGGSKRNVIPSSTEVVMWVPGAKAQALVSQLNDPVLEAELRASVDFRYQQFSYGAEIVAPDGVMDPIDPARTKAILGALAAIPNGVQSWSPVKADLVETSNNVAVLSTTANTLEVCCMTRSSKDGAIESFQEALRPALEQSGGAMRFEHESPGWEADPNNPLLVEAQKTFRGVLGFEPKIMAIHAGLECGAFRQHIPDIKMISFGPEIREAHTTKELIVLDTVEPYWRCLVSLLGEFAKAAKAP